MEAALGTVRFLDDPPFDLKLAKSGAAGAVLDTVLMTLPVFEPGPRQEVREIHVLMPRGEAHRLAHDLEKAWGVADMHARGSSR